MKCRSFFSTTALGCAAAFSAFLVWAADSGAANNTAQDTALAPVQVQAKKKKSTDLSFDDVLVQGKYHFSDEAVTTVEDDKILDALLGVRTDFKDRVNKSTARQ
jgi:hypothetical protein